MEEFYETDGYNHTILYLDANGDVLGYIHAQINNITDYSCELIIDCVPHEKAAIIETNLLTQIELIPKDGNGRYYALFVTPENRNKGIGKQLINCLFEKISQSFPNKKISAYIKTTNKSLSFYEKIGGVRIIDSGSRESGVQVYLEM